MLSRKEQNIIYDKYKSMMLSYLNKHYKMYDPEIIYNNTMYSVFTKINQFKGHIYSDSFDSWVWITLKHKAVDQVRSYSNHYKHIILTNTGCPSERGYIDQHHHLVYGEYIKKLLLYLPNQKYIDIFTDFIEGYKYKELNEKYDMPIGTLKWYINDARRIINSKIQLSSWMSKY